MESKDKTESGLNGIKEEALVQTTVEELIELNTDLLSAFSNPEKLDEKNMQQIMKLISRKKIDIKLLGESKIGKTLTKISEQKPGVFKEEATTDQSKNLLNQLKQMVKEQKRLKQIKAEKHAELEKLQKKENERIQNMKLPWIPEEIQQKVRNMSIEQEKMTLDFIKEIQTHPDHKSGKKHNRMDLLIAADRGYDLGHKIIQKFNGEAKPIQNKYRLLIFALFKNPGLSQLLINGELKIAELINYDEKQLRSDELKKKQQDIKDYKFQAERSDAMLCAEIEAGIESAMYHCIKCKSKQVTCRTQQTRGADEPMTEFYTCLKCGKSWKICP